MSLLGAHTWRETAGFGEKSTFAAMPARKKRAESALKHWKKGKENASPKSTNRPAKLKQWDNDSMVHAMEAVRSGKMGQNQAAKTYDVPRTTLKDRLSGRVKHGKKSGPEPYLTTEEEAELAEFLKQCARMGHGKTKKELFSIVQRSLIKKGRSLEHFNGEGWWNRFTQHHPKLSLRTSDPLSRVRANAVTKENMSNYFTLLEETLKKHDLLDKPSCIFNMDETGMPLSHKQPKRVAVKGMRKVHGPSTGDKTQITVVACSNAAGYTIPPMVIFKGQKFNHEWSAGEVPGTLYGMSESGWIDQELFSLWFEKLFIPNIPPQRPVMLMLDGHKSHYTPEAISRAATSGIIIFCIPPNTTHKAQPLDVSFFAPLKRYWSSVCHTFMVNNPGAVVTRRQFSQLFSQAWLKTIRPETVVNGFKKTGVYPLNKNAIEIFDDNPSSSESQSHCQSPNGTDSDPINSDPDNSINSTPNTGFCRIFATGFLQPV